VIVLLQGAPRKTAAARGGGAYAVYPAMRGGGRGGRGAAARGAAAYYDYSYDPYAYMGYYGYAPRGRGYPVRGGRGGYGAGRGRAYVGPPPGQPGESSGLQVRAVQGCMMVLYLLAEGDTVQLRPLMVVKCGCMCRCACCACQAAGGCRCCTG
jgi:hypothetical protein